MVHLRLLSSGGKKRVLRWIFASLFLLLVLAYNIAFYPPVFEKILIRGLTGVIPGRITAHVEKASLFRGFVFKDVEVRSENSPFFKASHVTLSYHLPSLLIGHIGIRDFSLVRPEIFLIKKNGVWNTDEVFGPPANKEPEPETPPRKSISTYVAVKLYGKFVIQDLHFNMDVQGKEAQFLDVDHLDLHAAFITRTFQEVPLNLHAFELFDTLMIGLAPNRPVNVVHRGAGDVSGEVKLPFFIFRDVSRGEPEFNSRFHLNTGNLTLHKNGRSLQPQVRLYYNVVYDAKKDSLRLGRLLAEQSGSAWLDLSANVDRLTSKNPSITLDMKQSHMDLTSVETILNFLGTTMNLHGNLSLFPLHMEGPLQSVSMNGSLRGNAVSLKAGNLYHSIPDLHLDMSAKMDLLQYMPVDVPEEKKERSGLAFGVFHSLLVPDLFVSYNNATIRGNAKIMPGEGVLVDLIVSRLRLAPFAGPSMDGVASGQIRLQSPESFRDLDVKSELHVSETRLRMQDSRSAPLELGLVANGKIGTGDTTTVSMDKLLLTVQNQSGVNLLTLNSATDMSFGELQNIQFHIKDLTVRYADLHSSLPGNLRYTLAPYRSYLDDGVKVSGSFGMRGTKDVTNITTDMMLAMPGIHLMDLAVHTSVSLSEKKTLIEDLKMTGLRGALLGTIKGSINKVDGKSVPDLTVNLGLSSKTLFAIHKNLALQGGLLMDFKIQADSVRGNVNANDLSLEIYTDCDAQSACKKMRIEKMNLALPIFHDLKIARPALLADSPAGLTFDAAQFRGDANLTIQFIASTHNPRGAIVKDGYFYSGSLLPGRGPGVSASLEYRKNVLYIKWLRYQIFRPKAREGNDVWVADGRIEGRDVFFNLADLSPRSMEFGGVMQIQNFDLEPYLPASRSNYDGVISAEMGFRGKDLGNALYNSDLRLSVYRLSREFSGFATRVVMPGQVAGFIVKSALEIPSITLELQNGLVYTTIGIARKDVRSFTTALSFIMKPTGEEIRQERIPLAQFLDRARSEVEAGVKVEERQ